MKLARSKYHEKMNPGHHSGVLSSIKKRTVMYTPVITPRLKLLSSLSQVSLQDLTSGGML